MMSVRMMGVGLWENIRICIRFVGIQHPFPFRSLSCWETGGRVKKEWNCDWNRHGVFLFRVALGNNIFRYFLLSIWTLI